MQDSKTAGQNPYESPRADCPPSALEYVAPDWSGRVPVILTSVCYGAFTLFLLESGGQDRKAGFMFLMNGPILLFWSVLEWRRHFISCFFGCASVGIQILITAMMLVTGIGDPRIVVVINGGITLGLLLVTGLSWRSRAKRRPTAVGAGTGDRAERQAQV